MTPPQIRGEFDSRIYERYFWFSQIRERKRKSNAVSTNAAGGGSEGTHNLIFPITSQAAKPSNFGAAAAPNPNTKIAKYNEEKFDIKTLHEKKAKRKDEKLPDDGSGKVQIWKIDNFTEVSLLLCVCVCVRV